MVERLTIDAYDLEIGDAMKIPKNVYWIIGGGIALILALVNFFVLRGDRVLMERARLGNTLEFNVPKAGENYLVEISSTRTKKRRRSYFLNLSVTDPDGKEVVKYEESLPRSSKRYVKFVSETTGKHKIKIGGRAFAAAPSLRVMIFVNDKRLVRFF
jgi:hypothetical protein